MLGAKRTASNDADGMRFKLANADRQNLAKKLGKILTHVKTEMLLDGGYCMGCNIKGPEQIRLDMGPKLVKKSKNVKHWLAKNVHKIGEFYGQFQCPYLCFYKLKF